MKIPNHILARIYPGAAYMLHVWRHRSSGRVKILHGPNGSPPDCPGHGWELVRSAPNNPTHDELRKLRNLLAGIPGPNSTKK